VWGTFERKCAEVQAPSSIGEVQSRWFTSFSASSSPRSLQHQYSTFNNKRANMSPSPPRDTDPEPKAAESKPELKAAESKSEASRARSRSRSPRRSPPRKPKNFSGLKWKNNKRDDRDRDDRRRDDRGGRDRRDYDRDDRRRDDGFSDRRGDDRRRDERRDDRRGEDDRRRDDRRRDDRDRKPRDDRHPDRKPREEKDKDKKPAAPAIASTGEAMIIVTVNDRLGTKTQVPCLPSDPIKVLKAMVAAKIGRPVHEIMLKRQGERPFHDQLSLADYSISNGVQIDLELNTGD
jgi:hypothetical protein